MTLKLFKNNFTETRNTIYKKETLGKDFYLSVPSQIIEEQDSNGGREAEIY